MLNLFGPARSVLTAGVLASAALGGAPAFAAQEDIIALKSYIGEWRGRGVMQGARSETVVCRLNVTAGNQDRVTFAGRCALAGTNMSIRGTIAFNERANRYEAAMTSDIGFSPDSAFGKRQGDAIVFELEERTRDTDGKAMQISANMLLRGDQIEARFRVVFVENGQEISASVPFTR